MNAGLHERLFQLVNYSIDHSNNTRVHLWQGHWAIFQDNPVFGVGLLEGDKFLPEYFARLDIQEEFYSHAHSNYLQWLSGTGLIGLILYLYIAWFFAKGAWDLRRRDSWGWGLLLAQLYFHLGGISEASFFDGEVNHFIVFVWAMTWARMNHFTVMNPAAVRKAK
jgi:O-antigen ligase